MEILLRKDIVAAVLAVAALAGTPAPAANVVGPAVQKLHLSPQQLLSLRDTLGDFSRGTEVEASGDNLFILRDAGTMTYAGEFSLTVAASGALQIDRVSGPAKLDTAHSLLLPLHLAAKSRGQVTVALAGSQVIAPLSALPDNVVPSAPAALPDQTISSLTLTDARASGPLSETRAVFFRDGSGWQRSLRALLSPAGAAPSPIRLADRYYPAIRSDGKRVWRDAVIEIDSDVQLHLSDLDNRYRCAPGALCSARGPMVTPGAMHFIRWGQQIIAAVPPSLLTQMAPPAIVPATAGTESPPAEPPPQLPGTVNNPDGN